MVFPDSLRRSAEGTARLRETVVKVLVGENITGYHTTKVRELFDWFYCCIVDSDVGRGVVFHGRWLVQHLSLFQADSKAEGLGRVREVVYQVL